MKYLVIYRDTSGSEDEMFGKDGLYEPQIETAKEIFNTMDMSDCIPIEIAALWCIHGTLLIPCVLNGTWSHFDDPLRMEIAIASSGAVIDTGYGTDH